MDQVNSVLSQMALKTHLIGRPELFHAHLRQQSFHQGNHHLGADKVCLHVEDTQRRVLVHCVGQHQGSAIRQTDIGQR